MSIIGAWFAKQFPRAPVQATPVAPLVPPMPFVPTVHLDVAMLAKLGWDKPEQWAPVLLNYMRMNGQLNTKQRAAAFLANTGHETNGGRRLVESLNYTADRLVAVFGSARATTEAIQACRAPGKLADERRIANIVYGGEWGLKNLGNTMPDDGWRFRGRGLIQVTGRRNYEAMAKALWRECNDGFLADFEKPETAAAASCTWWSRAGVNEIADTGDVTKVRRKVNGGLVGLDDVQARYSQAMAAL